MLALKSYTSSVVFSRTLLFVVAVFTVIYLMAGSLPAWALDIYKSESYQQANSKEYAISDAWHLKCVSKLDQHGQSAKYCELEPTSGSHPLDSAYRMLNGVKVAIWNAYDPYKGIEPNTSVKITGVLYHKEMSITVGGQRFSKLAENKAHGYEWYADEANKIILQLLNAPNLQYEYDLFARYVNRGQQSLQGFREAWDHAVKFTRFNPFRGIGL